MVKVSSRLVSSAISHKGFKKYLKEIASDPICAKKLIIDELKSISSVRSLNLKTNSIQDISRFWYKKEAPYQECTLDVVSLSKVTGDGIAYSKELEKFIIVPFTSPGDKIVVSLKRHYEYFAEGNFIRFNHKENRKLKAPCKYFATCNGCQLQEMKYQEQLNFKKDTIKFAFQNQFKTGEFDKLIQDTVGSPLKYNYRTKLTPHYDDLNSKEEMVIGLNGIDSKVVDIERCEIATELVNEGLQVERDRLHNLGVLKAGSLSIRENYQVGTGSNSYNVDPRGIITENVNGRLFQFPAYSFFQNNNSILPVLLKFVESQLSTSYKNLVDTYCGCGLFSISLSNNFQKSIGIEISSKAIEFAKINANLNNLSNVSFITGTASEIFKDLKGIDPNETCVLMDPSRKGSNMDFLKQLSFFKPGLIIYVSCNVYSQAKDLFDFLHILGMDEHYNVREIRGFDFFPQTKHVESIAILELKNGV